VSINSSMVSINEIPLADTVDSLNHPLAGNLRQLLTRQKRLESSEMIIDDIQNIEEALTAKVKLLKLFISGTNLEIPKLFLDKLPTLPICAIAPRTAKKIFEKDKMTRIFAVAEMPLKTLHNGSFNNLNKDIIVLDGVNISGNIGAIMRTAAALNVGGIIVLNMDLVDLYDRRIIRASRGYIFRVLVTTSQPEDLVSFCQQQHFQLLIMTADAKQTISEVAKSSNKLAIVLGGEKAGCSPYLAHHSSLSAKIPMNPMVESLNVSVAAGIVLYLRLTHNN
jgi:tRNA G18 (ribose-2'-O)-methylase SpoU